MNQVLEQQTARNGGGVTAMDVLAMMMDALSARVFRLVTLLLAFALFGYATLEPDWRRLAAAIAFAVLVHGPTWFRSKA